MFNQTFNELHLEKHPDKTVMGRTEKRFDFLGYHFSPERLKNLISHAVRLYEQGREEPSGSPLLGLYEAVVYLGAFSSNTTVYQLGYVKPVIQ
jgi:RNA-directed DNA polymerase